MVATFLELFLNQQSQRLGFYFTIVWLIQLLPV